MNRLHPRDWRSVLLLSALLLALYYPAIRAWAGGGWAFGEDAPGLFAPWRAFAASEIRAGRWPLWNPWIFGGLPLALNGQAALGYPPNVIFWILPFKTALLLDALFHSLLLGAGGYFLGRALGMSRTASSLLGLCLGANGSVASHVYAGHVTWHDARAWVPWMLWALVLGLRTRRVRYAYALALFFFLQFAAGYPPLALMGAGLCACGFVAFLLLARVDSPRPNWLAQNAWAWRWGLIAGLLGLGLVVSLALPLREVSGLSVHGSGLPWEQASELSGTWKSLARWIVPGAFGLARPLQWSLPYGAQEEASAIGILPTILALGAPLWARPVASRRRALALWMLWAAMLGCTLLALGSSTPLYRLLFEHVGLLRVLRFPVRWLEPWSILASLAGALTFDAWYRAAKSQARSPLSHKYLRGILDVILSHAAIAALVLGAAAASASLWLASRALSAFWIPLLNSVNGGIAPEWRAGQASQMRAMAWGECAWAMLLCVATAWILTAARRDLGHASVRRSMLPWKLLVALVAVELGSLFVRSREVREYRRPEIPPELAAQYARGERWVTSVDWRSINAGMAAGVEISNGYDAMNTRAVWNLAQAVAGKPLWVDMFQPKRLSPPLRIAGVTHALIHTGLPRRLPPGSRLVGSVREWRLWRIFQSRDVWPRLFLSRRVRSVPESQVVPALSQMARLPSPRGGADWPLLLIKDGKDEPDASASTYGAPGPAPSGRVEHWSARPDVLECRVVADADCWLGVSQAWSPAWKAWVNGRPVDLERANGPFCALRIGRGVSQVRLSYEPQSWRMGPFVGLCALAALAAGGAAFWARKRRWATD